MGPLTLTLLLAVSSSAAALAAKPQLPHPANPFLSPSTDPYNPLRYIASNTLTAVAFTLYIACALIMSLWMWKRGARWMAAMVVGAYTFSIGLALRFGLHIQPESKGLYIVEYLLVVLSPCAFIAADYVLLGRLARHLNVGQHLLINPRLITRVFISSDVTTFLIQAIGGSISISGSTTGNLAKSRLGSHIFLAGLAIQLASFFFFTLVYLLFLYRVRTYAPQVWNPTPRPVWWKHWRTLSAVMFASCVGILIRSAYRTVELSQGFEGPLAVSEKFLYGLDTFPLLVAIMVYVPFWPGQFINEETSSAFVEEASLDSAESTSMEEHKVPPKRAEEHDSLSSVENSMLYSR